jgi:hypothetical protein
VQDFYRGGYHSGRIVQTIPSCCEKPFAFPPESLFPFSPESYSPSLRNAFTFSPESYSPSPDSAHVGYSHLLYYPAMKSDALGAMQVAA